MAKNQIIVCSFWCLLLLQFSCQKVKINELIPDSCEVLVKINFPELISAKGDQKFLSAAVHTKYNVRLEDSGIDFFQPAYFFKTDLGTESGYFLLAGIASESDFIKTLEKLNPEGRTTVSADFQTFDLENARVVWHKNRCVFSFFNQVIGPVLKPEQIQVLLDKEKLKRSPDMFPDNKMISFRADVQEENTLPMLPPLDAAISGSLQLNANVWQLDAVLKEGQFSSFLLPFDAPNLQQKQNCNAQLAIKPDWEKLGGVLSNYFDIPYLQELILNLNTIKGPVLATTFGCLPVENQKNIVVEAQFETDENGQKIIDLYQQLGNLTVFPNDFQLKKIEDHVRFSSKANQDYLIKLPVNENKKSLLRLILQQEKSKLNLNLQSGKQKGEIIIQSEILNPEMFEMPESADFLDHLQL